MKNKVRTLPQLIEEIKKKKEFSSLPQEIIKRPLARHLNSSINFHSPKDLKLIVKKVRADLRKSVGQYQKGSKNREKLLESRDFKSLLKTHSSTSERLNFYPTLKKKISSLHPKSILDLGCGLNPIAISNHQTQYFASDIRSDELLIISKYFKLKKIQGTTFVYDLSSSPTNLPLADLCLIFKVLDIVPNNREVTKTLLEKVKCKHFLVSFPTKKLSGRSMRSPKRKWFEKILANLDLDFRTFNSPNEIFYLITNSQRKQKTT